MKTPKPLTMAQIAALLAKDPTLAPFVGKFPCGPLPAGSVLDLSLPTGFAAPPAGKTMTDLYHAWMKQRPRWALPTPSRN